MLLVPRKLPLLLLHQPKMIVKLDWSRNNWKDSREMLRPRNRDKLTLKSKEKLLKKKRNAKLMLLKNF
jgi:hypothetical protein